MSSHRRPRSRRAARRWRGACRTWPYTNAAARVRAMSAAVASAEPGAVIVRTSPAAIDLAEPPVVVKENVPLVAMLMVPIEAPLERDVHVELRRRIGTDVTNRTDEIALQVDIPRGDPLEQQLARPRRSARIEKAQIIQSATAATPDTAADRIQAVGGAVGVDQRHGGGGRVLSRRQRYGCSAQDEVDAVRGRPVRDDQ